jgi:hypothetical protein
MPSECGDLGNIHLPIKYHYELLPSSTLTFVPFYFNLNFATRITIIVHVGCEAEDASEDTPRKKSGSNRDFLFSFFIAVNNLVTTMQFSHVY